MAFLDSRASAFAQPGGTPFLSLSTLPLNALLAIVVYAQGTSAIPAITGPSEGEVMFDFAAVSSDAPNVRLFGQFIRATSGNVLEWVCDVDCDEIQWDVAYTQEPFPEFADSVTVEAVAQTGFATVSEPLSIAPSLHYDWKSSNTLHNLFVAAFNNWFSGTYTGPSTLSFNQSAHVADGYHFNLFGMFDSGITTVEAKSKNTDWGAISLGWEAPPFVFPKCYLHVPHKYWAESLGEQNNYLALERWVRDIFRRFGVDQDTSSFLPLHLPFKQWSAKDTDNKELENYVAIERWGTQVLPLVSGLAVGTGSLTRYDLNIPHKTWAVDAELPDGRLELENYLAIERWARRVVRECFPTSGCGCG